MLKDPGIKESIYNHYIKMEYGSKIDNKEY